MEQVLRWLFVLFALFLVLRVSLARRGRSFGLGAGQTLSNLGLGALIGLAVAAWAGPALEREAGRQPFAAALAPVLPFVALILGGIAGFLALGGIWQRLQSVRGRDACARARRVQVAVGLALGAVLLVIWLLP